jgi:hypothetical protein
MRNVIAIIIVLILINRCMFAQNNSIALSQMRFSPNGEFQMITTNANGMQYYIPQNLLDIDTRVTNVFFNNDTLNIVTSRVSGQNQGILDTLKTFIPIPPPGGVSINAGIGISLSGDGSPGNPFIITNTSPDLLVTLTAGSGVSVSGTYPNFTINNTSPDQIITIAGGGINAVTGTYPNFTITGTEIDGSITNEGRLSVSAGGANDALLNTNTSGSNSVMFAGGTGIAISETTSSNGGTITITNSAPDQTVVLNAGTGISTTGTYPNFTISNTAPNQTVNITGSTGITVGGAYPNFTLTVADQSATNELQNLSISNDTLFISSGNFVLLPQPGSIDTATFLINDSILVYSVNGVEFGRDTIRLAGGGGGDNWGSQVVESDATLLGTGIIGNLLRVDTTSIATRSYVTSQGYLTANQTVTLSGDVTGSGATSITATIANNAVSNGKFRQSAGLSVVGRSANSTGNVADITAGSNNQFLVTRSNTLGFGTLTATDIPDLSATYYLASNPSGFTSNTGTVTSVGLSLPGIFSVSNSPVTGAGTLTATFNNQNANLVFAGPASGGAAAPSFRSLVSNDIPNLDMGKITTGNLAWSRIITTPTTLSGYGITDGVINTRAINTTGSVSGGGNLSADRTLQLVGDNATPGNSKYYGTNSTGTKGFFDLPTGGGGGGGSCDTVTLIHGIRDVEATVSIGTSETLIDSVKITPLDANAKILVISIGEYTKDGGTTVRTLTQRIRRGITTSDPQVGNNSVARSINVSNAPYMAPVVTIAIDSPGVATPVNYSLTGQVDAGASTAQRTRIMALDLSYQTCQGGGGGAIDTIFQNQDTVFLVTGADTSFFILPPATGDNWGTQVVQRNSTLIGNGTIGNVLGVDTTIIATQNYVTSQGYTTNTGTVTSVSGTGTVNGITLSGTVTSSGNLTLGGTLSNVSLTTQVTGTLPVGNGGSGATSLTGVLIGNGTSAFTGVTGTASQLLRRNATNTAYEFFTHDFVSTSRNINTSGSLTGGGNLTADRTLQLVNDNATPGNSQYYGTNSSGTKGYYALPSGGGVDTATFLNQDSILIYSVAGVEFGRDTIRTTSSSGGQTLIAGNGITFNSDTIDIEGVLLKDIYLQADSNFITFDSRTGSVFNFGEDVALLSAWKNQNTSVNHSYIYLNAFFATPEVELSSVDSMAQTSFVVKPDIITVRSGLLGLTDIYDLPITAPSYTTSDTTILAQIGTGAYATAVWIPLPNSTVSIDTATFLINDSILVYSVAGVEFGRDTIRISGDNWGSQVVESDATLTGNGTSGNQLKVDTTIIATQSYVTTRGYITGNQTITLSGDVTGSGATAITATIGNNAVTNAKLRQSSALSVIGRSANSTGDVADIAAGGNNQFLVTRSNVLGFGSLTATDIPDLSLTYYPTSNPSGFITSDTSTFLFQDSILRYYANGILFDSDTIRLPSGSGGEVNTASNLGSGFRLFAQKSGVELQFKTINGSEGIQLDSTSTEVTIKRRNVITPFDTTATAYTLALTDMDRRVFFSSGSNVTVTIPTDASVPFPIGTVLTLYRDGAGELAIDPAGTVTLQSAQGYRRAAHRYQAVELYKIGSNEWRLIGDLKN